MLVKLEKDTSWMCEACVLYFFPSDHNFNIASAQLYSILFPDLFLFLVHMDANLFPIGVDSDGKFGSII